MNGWLVGGIAAAAVVGLLLPLQALINARLAQATEGALFASFVSFAVGTLLLAVALLVTRVPVPDARTLVTQPAWVWTGGLIGAMYVLSATVLVPRLGAAGLICLVVSGQLIGSLLFDHFGVLGPERPADGWRVLGAVLVALGAVLVLRPEPAA